MAVNLGPNFYLKLVEMASELGTKPEDLINVMISESGLNPSAHNPHGGASGLIQFMPSTLKGLGFNGTPEDFRRLSGEQQLPYIKKLIKGNMALQGGKPFTSAGHHYVSIFWPVALKLKGVQDGNPNTAIIEKNPESINGFSKKYIDVGSKIRAASETAAYNANPLFDRDKKGYITLGDLNKQTEMNSKNSIYNSAISTMEKETGYKQRQSSSSSSFLVDKIDTLLDNIMKSFSNDRSIKKKAFQKLIPHEFLISIKSSSTDNSIEFARILCQAIDEELFADANILTNHKDVEVETILNGPKQLCQDALLQLCNALSQTFEKATHKIGSIEVFTVISTNMKSNLKSLNIKTACQYYDRFHNQFKEI